MRSNSRKYLVINVLISIFTLISHGSCQETAAEQPALPATPTVPGPVPEGFLEPSAETSRKPVTRLGLAVAEVSPEDIGLNVLMVIENGPAHEAGVLPNDVITRFNDQILIAAKQLEVLVKTSPPGTEARLELQRAGEILRLPVTLDIAQPSLPPSPEQVSRDFEITRRVMTLTVDEGDSSTRIAMTTLQEKAHLIISNDQAVQFDGPISEESQIPPHLLPSIQKVASLKNGRWEFHLPILPPVDSSPEGKP